jgi:hypothetical protein
MAMKFLMDRRRANLPEVVAYKAAQEPFIKVDLLHAHGIPAFEDTLDMLDLYLAGLIELEDMIISCRLLASTYVPGPDDE